MSAATSRRALIGSSAAMLVTGACEAGSTKADELDGDIIRASAAWVALDVEYDKACIEADTASEPQKTELTTRMDVICDEQDGLMEILIETPARTPEGLRAKAAALRKWIPPNRERTAPAMEDDVLAWSLCDDLLGRA